MHHVNVPFFIISGLFLSQYTTKTSVAKEKTLYSVHSGICAIGHQLKRYDRHSYLLPGTLCLGQFSSLNHLFGGPFPAQGG